MKMIFGGQNNSGSKAGKDKVVVMDRFRSRSPVSPMRQAEAYWTALRRGDDIPSRSQIDPRGLENILSQTFILERVAPGIARFRLAGQKVNEMAGMEVRGMPLTAFFTPDSRKTVSATLEQMFDGPSIVELELRTQSTRMRGSREARMILLPLRSDLGDVSRALGVFVSEGNASRVSQRFSVVDYDIRKVSTSNSKTDAASAPAAPEAPKPLATPETAAPTRPNANTPELGVIAGTGSAKKAETTKDSGFSEEQPVFVHKSPSLMQEARALLSRARRENEDALRTARPKDAAPASPTASTPTVDAESLVSRPPRGGKLKKSAPHLRLVVSRD